MSRLSASASLEAKILSTLRTIAPGVHAVGLLEVADAGTQKDEDMTALQVRVYNFVQPNEALPVFTATVEIRLNVEQAESANGGVFFENHEAVSLWLERIMLSDACAELSTDEVEVNGLQRIGDDKDFDMMDGVWFAVWNLTLSGRIKQETTDNE
nr:MAG TPA: hypothetical protein [Caudoviricetes sp.]